ncbi:sugar phosphate isomerase/epimerase [Danxiaibacter flavus]|uniref:Sugar phosphate isomerase/epimerase n=1 Tax=Danxiaibacter flavus TaxID=3049108 RepID=A0ABV3ZL34_9BACT|nr:sugar phosphate isomerase/epimerase [Chitinophagaceae bacterium DXS]
MQTRRSFIKQAALLTATTIMQPGNMFKKEYKLGLQFYTIRDPLAADLKGTLQKISGFRYREAETYGFNGKTYYGQDPKVFAQMLADNNITTSSGHYDLDKYILGNSTQDDMKRYVDQCIDGAHTLKQDYIVWPWLDPSWRSMEKFKHLAQVLNTIGEQIKKGGLQLAYHNHDFEFVDHNGQIGYDVILNETDPSLVKLEADLYWMSRASAKKPHEWFELQPGRFVIWHIKDMDKNNPDLHTAVGDGTIDFRTIMPDANKAGVKHMFVEQGNNYVPDALNCVERSAKYIQRENLFLI